MNKMHRIIIIIKSKDKVVTIIRSRSVILVAINYNTGKCVLKFHIYGCGNNAIWFC